MSEETDISPTESGDFGEVAKYAQTIKEVGEALGATYPNIDFNNPIFTSEFFNAHFANVQLRLEANDRVTVANAGIVEAAIQGKLDTVHNKVNVLVDIVTEESDNILKRWLALVHLYDASKIGSGATIKESAMFQDIVSSALPTAVSAEATAFAEASKVIAKMNARHQRSIDIAAKGKEYASLMANRPDIESIVIPGFSDSLSTSAQALENIARQAMEMHTRPDYADLINFVLYGQMAVTALNVTEEEAAVQQYIVSAAQVLAMTSCVTFIDSISMKGLYGNLYSAQKRLVRSNFRKQITAALAMIKNPPKIDLANK